MDKPLAKGDELCRVLEEFVDLEWRRFQGQQVNIKLGDGSFYREDNSRYPPVTSFRLKKENKEFIEKLKGAIDGYKGLLVWKIYAHQRLTLAGTNWVIHPAFFGEASAMAEGGEITSARNFMAEHHPDFAPIAYRDLLVLAEHVRKKLNE